MPRRRAVSDSCKNCNHQFLKALSHILHLGFESTDETHAWCWTCARCGYDHLMRKDYLRHHLKSSRHAKNTISSNFARSPDPQDNRSEEEPATLPTTMNVGKSESHDDDNDINMGEYQEVDENIKTMVICPIRTPTLKIWRMMSLD